MLVLCDMLIEMELTSITAPSFLVLCLFAVSCQGQPEVNPGIEYRSPERLHERLIELEQFMAGLETRHKASANGDDGGDMLLGREKRVGSFRLHYPNFLSANGIHLRAGSDSAGENGFYVSLGRTAKLTTGKKITFDTITTNIGNVYDINTSEFTCPRSGAYIFHMSLSCEEGSYLEASIVKVNKDNVVNPVFNTICDHRPGTGYYQNGGSAILQLSVGDKVAVKMLWPNHVEEAVTGKGLTTFSGYLLNSK